ncbi:hypothetical protein WISP_13185 [Willisornis vidua]|uniref:Reverse transcriptase domain-containing protein n=1 Tax=Willisornis vidua TaxID=1566151 RepID=A0ABQ9DQN0_9PASS|nr:hypothetical protein WISP_13185 [Willisornis vidua]
MSSGSLACADGQCGAAASARDYSQEPEQWQADSECHLSGLRAERVFIFKHRNRFKNSSKEQDNWPSEPVDRDRELNSLPVIQEEAVSALLSHLDPHKSMVPGGIYLRVMRELVDELAKPLSIIYQLSWLAREVPDDYRLVNVIPIQKEGQKEDLVNHRPISLTSVPSKVMERIILSAIMWQLQDGQGIRPRQCRFRKGKSCLTNLIFYDPLSSLVDESKGCGCGPSGLQQSL